ncbi:hypothetical protein SRB17_84040 [Streptomyces sp. RB17]|uniref:hypothetical protein n=1 Tax=Streptomyces sp. RB17 TaxID=2585197 RepID=UPI001297D9D1|nr:hypothetical protein [Streptomyces sp. RB17]MQY40371.1 hypothetical protein [Streptomyces sp. RB17]
MPTVPEAAKASLAQKLTARARTAWPKLTGLDVRYRGQFASVDGELAHGESIKLMRPRYGGSASTWGFALYLAGTDKYEDSILPTGTFAGTPEEALDCARGLYLTAPGI